MAVVPTSRRRRRRLRLLAVLGAAIAASSLLAAASAAALVGEACSASSAGGGCGAGLRCTSCVPPPGTGPAACARTTPLDPKTHGTGLPFNKYAWLTTHNSFAMVGTKSPIGSAIISPPNQEDTVTAQLRNGVRGLMLDTYDFNNEVWLCHSFNGKCLAFTAYQRAVTVLKEILAFLESNPSEVVTVFVEDYTAPGSLGKVFAAAGLTKYILPAAKMPKNGGDWPLLKDMISQNHRLVVFTSKQGRESSDGIPYEWAYVVENQYGSEGLAEGKCGNRAESKAMSSTAQSLVLMNFFTTNPSQSWACGNNSSPLVNKLKTCYDASAKRWPNFIAVDFYMRSTGGGAPLATDVANGRLQCGCDSISYCKANAQFGSCSMSPSSPGASAAPPRSTPASSPGPAPAAAPHQSSSSSPSPGPAAAAFAPAKSSPSPGPATATPAKTSAPSAAAPKTSPPSATTPARNLEATATTPTPTSSPGKPDAASATSSAASPEPRSLLLVMASLVLTTVLS